MTRRAKAEEWLSSLRGEVDNIVHSIEEYLESRADTPPSVIGEFSFVADVVDDKKVGIRNRLMMRKSSTQHMSYVRRIIVEICTIQWE